MAKGDEFNEISISCMICGEDCKTWEEVDIGVKEFEIWCYCEKCDAETFHPIVSGGDLKNYR